MSEIDLRCEKIIGLLSDCYKKTNEFDLGGLLGAISLDNVFSGERADDALYNDMKKVVESCPPHLSDSAVAIAVLRNYHSLYGFGFSQTIELLLSAPIED